MPKKLLVREIKQMALTRMEDAARTENDFNGVIELWDKLDDNRERKERDHEVARADEIMLYWDTVNKESGSGEIRLDLEIIIPPPFLCKWWKQILRGEFIDYLYCDPDYMWQVVEDWDVSKQLKYLSMKQRDIVYLIALKGYKTKRVAKLQSKTERAIRKLYVTAIIKMRKNLSEIITKQIEAGYIHMTWDKRKFLEFFNSDKGKKAKKIAPDIIKSDNKTEDSVK